MNKKLYIHANNIHIGGGLVLLKSLLKAINFQSYITVDSRSKLYLNNNLILKNVKPNLISRFYSEYLIYIKVSRFDTLLCFGNLPPLFKSRGNVYVFLQNRYLIDNNSLGCFPLWSRVRLWVERIWLNLFKNNVDVFVVQTESMKILLESKIKKKVPILILPFVSQDTEITDGLNLQNGLEYDFLYVASGDPHKNHLCLFEAWKLLAKDGIFPSLCITIDEFKYYKICREIAKFNKIYGNKIINLGVLSHSNTLLLFKKSRALIFPSKFESFGLPLIEAKRAGLPILAPELDYVRDILDPDHTFNPESSISIARAVMRFLGKDSQFHSILSPSQFLSTIYGED